jgi:hypothetical protein
MRDDLFETQPEESKERCIEDMEASLSVPREDESEGFSDLDALDDDDFDLGFDDGGSGVVSDQTNGDLDADNDVNVLLGRLLALGSEENVEMRTAVMLKNEMIALLCIKSASQGAAICRVDPREPLPAIQLYDDAESATEWYVRSLRTSQKNGWRIAYYGLPLRG